jgi:hypothetical protein
MQVQILVASEGNSHRQVVDLAKNEITIGRGPECSLRLESSLVSASRDRREERHQHARSRQLAKRHPRRQRFFERFRGFARWATRSPSASSWSRSSGNRRSPRRRPPTPIRPARSCSRGFRPRRGQRREVELAAEARHAVSCADGSTSSCSSTSTSRPSNPRTGRPACAPRS